MKKILIIEDDVTTQQLYRMLLKDRNVYCTFCSTINEALIHLLRGSYHLVISCLNIEERNCAQFLQLLAYWKPKVPIVLISGSERQKEHASVEYAVSERIAKPISKNQFSSMLEKYLFQNSHLLV